MGLSRTQITELLTFTRNTLEKTGQYLLGGLNKDKNISYKSTIDLVTIYDKNADEMIRSALQKEFPEIGILLEESGVTQTTDKTTARWIIDPLDGTTNFAHGHPFFAVCAGLEDEGELVAGTTVIPAFGISMWAQKGMGTFRNGQMVSVSKINKIEKSLMTTGFPYDRRTNKDNNIREFSKFIKMSQGNRRCGSAAIDLAFTACGIYDGFWEPKLQPWDIAAGIVLVREAGGRVTDYNNLDVDLEKGWIVASNGLIHDDIIDVLKNARKNL